MQNLEFGKAKEHVHHVLRMAVLKLGGSVGEAEYAHCYLSVCLSSQTSARDYGGKFFWAFMWQLWKKAGGHCLCRVFKQPRNGSRVIFLKARKLSRGRRRAVKLSRDPWKASVCRRTPICMTKSASGYQARRPQPAMMTYNSAYYKGR